MKVEIWSDVVCPWCYVGKRRFESALAGFGHRDDVTVEWRSFELNPDARGTAPAGTLAQRLADKYGMSLQQAKAKQAELTAVAAADGLGFHFELARSGNTFDAHRLIHYAGKLGLQDAAKERLLRAYFTEGEAIGEPETLIRLVSEIGIDAEAARAVLNSDAYAAEVRADERRASMLGIQGVPFFVVDEKYGVSGAQPAAALLEVLETAWAEAHPLTLSAGANVCVGDECLV